MANMNTSVDQYYDTREVRKRWTQQKADGTLNMNDLSEEQKLVILLDNNIHVQDVLDIFIKDSRMDGEQHLRFAESIYHYILDNPVSVQMESRHSGGHTCLETNGKRHIWDRS